MFLIGILASLYPQVLVNPSKGEYLKKIARLKKLGYLILAISVIFTKVKITEHL
jgi:hypothetical protein